MTRAEIIRWPAKTGNDLAPWYWIIWRMLWANVIYLGLAIAWLGTFCSWGYREARRFWWEAQR